MVEANYTVKDAAKRLNISERMLRKELWERKLAHVRIGRKVLITESEIQSYLERHTVSRFERGAQ